MEERWNQNREINSELSAEARRVLKQMKNKMSKKEYERKVAQGETFFKWFIGLLFLAGVGVLFVKYWVQIVAVVLLVLIFVGIAKYFS